MSIGGLSERLRAAHPNSMQRINGSDILLEAATALDALQARVKELGAARMGQIDYSVDLQRIIEGLCHERTIREPQTGARYHYDLAMDYRAKCESRATRAEQERASEWNLRREAEGQRDAALAAAGTLRAERDEAYERLKPFANGSIDVSGTAVIVGYPDAEHALKAARDCVRQLKIASGPDREPNNVQR